MLEEYTLKQVKTAFFRCFRGGGELRFKDSWGSDEGSMLIDWKGFLEELRKTVKQNEIHSEGS